MEKLVVIPTYNEKENIASILSSIFALQQDYHVLVIDDGSPDGTAEIVKELQSTYLSQLFLEERKGKLGLGTAYIRGFKWALQKGYNYILRSMLIFLIIQKIFPVCMMHVKRMEPMWLLAHCM